MIRRLSQHAWVAGLAIVTACHSENSTTPVLVTPVATTVAIIAGNNQQADPGDSLADAVQFLVTDEQHRPMANVSVVLSVPLGGGTVPATSVTTDSTGVATTSWTMGPGGGVQTLEAHVTPQAFASATATTCDPEACYPSQRLSSTLATASLLSLATYERSGQAVHPDIVRAHGGATGFWMVVTPYPGGNIVYENPSIFKSKNAVTWTVPAGLANPIATPAFNGYLSDPDLVVNSDNSLWVFFRSVLNSQNVVELTRSKDGTHWDSATAVITVPSHELLSPTVVRGAPHGKWQMWSVNSGSLGCSSNSTYVERRTSDDGIHWNQPIPVQLSQGGQQIWHIDVQWVPARAEYWALYNTYPDNTSCATNALYLARSKDGVTWLTYPSPIARAGVIDAFKSIVYRSTFMVDPTASQVTLWMSGAAFKDGVGYDWRTGTVSIAIPDLLAIASVVPTMVRENNSDRLALPPPEPDGPTSH